MADDLKLFAGRFDTTEIHPPDQPQQQHAALRVLHPAPPQIAVGLSSVEMDRNQNFRLKVKATNVTPSNFNAEINSSGDTVLYSAGMPFLEIAESSLIQTGTFNTSEVSPPDQQKQNSISKRIDFGKRYPNGPPKVICWINAFDYHNLRNFRLLVYASDIDATGFTATITAWGDSLWYSAGLTWIAHPSDHPNIASGSYDTLEKWPWHDPHTQVSGTVSLGNKFSKTPKMVVALHRIDSFYGKNLRVRSTTSDRTASGFTWHLDTWDDSILYNAGASWFAWA